MTVDPGRPGPLDAVLLDVDGTLVDSNYHHVLAWSRAFSRFGVAVPAWRIHKSVGMGGDRLVSEVAGPEVEEQHGDGLRSAWTEEVTPLLGEIRVLDGAQQLLTAARDAGLAVVLASSGKPEHLDHYLDLLGGPTVVDAWTTSADVATTKPAPDLLEVAMHKVTSRAPLVVGDSTWDAVAAGKLSLPVWGVLSGGFAREELLHAGAERVFDALPDLAEALAARLAAPSGPAAVPTAQR